jgi:regulatory protein
MAVVESVETGKDRLKLGFDDGSSLDVGTAYLPPEYSGAFLCPGAVVSPETETVLRHAAECCSAEKAALRLVARAEQCCMGLSIKLERRGHSSAAVCAVLSRLAELNLVNDERYAELWLKYRINRGYRGPRELTARLCAKGIDWKTAEAALKAVLSPETEAALLRRCLAKAGFTEGDREIRYFLKSRAFSQDAIDAYFEEDA